MSTEITVVGGGLAGCEAAWQLAERGYSVVLIEQKPGRISPAHTTPLLGELVCSNSLRSNDPASPAGLLKEELRRAGSLIVKQADAHRVPAGDALAVDRHAFSRAITLALALHPNVQLVRRPLERLPEGPVILAGGPLVAGGVARELRRLCGDRLYFYDAIAPIIEADSIDWKHAFRGSRYGKDTGTNEGDYVNCPMTTDEYRAFVEAVRAGQKVPPHPFEEPKYFEGCLPIEVMAERGDDVLAFGPMKPVGLDTDAHAVVQLRAENRWSTSYNLVGFQTRLTYPEQKRIFAMIPALGSAEFLRFGSIHRNSYIESWKLLDASLALRARPNIHLAGQITGVEGYIESTAMGLLCARFVDEKARGLAISSPPEETAFGALYHHLTRHRERGEKFVPTNINFGLLPPLNQRAKKRDRRALHAERARSAFGPWIAGAITALVICLSSLGIAVAKKNPASTSALPASRVFLDVRSMRYLAPTNAAGVVEAWDKATKSKRWSTHVYGQEKSDELMPRAIEEVAITALALDGETLVVVDGRKREYDVDLASHASTPWPARGLDDLARPAFRKLPDTSGEILWSWRLSPPLPLSWPPMPEQTVVYAYGGGQNPQQLSDAEHQSAPWARILEEPGQAARLDPLGKTLDKLGLIGVHPVDATLALNDAERAIAERRARRLMPSLVKQAPDALVQRRYCAWSSGNSLVAERIAARHAAFFAWLACPK